MFGSLPGATKLQQLILLLMAGMMAVVAVVVAPGVFLLAVVVVVVGVLPLAVLLRAGPDLQVAALVHEFVLCNPHTPPPSRGFPWPFPISLSTVYSRSSMLDSRICFSWTLVQRDGLPPRVSYKQHAVHLCSWIAYKLYNGQLQFDHSDGRRRKSPC